MACLRLRMRYYFFVIQEEPIKFHPRISANQSYIYRELSGSDRYAFDQLYWHFFYHRHNDFGRRKRLSVDTVGCVHGDVGFVEGISV